MCENHKYVLTAKESPIARGARGATASVLSWMDTAMSRSESPGWLRAQSQSRAFNLTFCAVNRTRKISWKALTFQVERWSRLRRYRQWLGYDFE